MSDISDVVLDGKSLTPALVYKVAVQGAKIVLSDQGLQRVTTANEFLLDEAGKNAVYGVTTGFGPMVSHIIGKSQVKELQYNLVRSHAVGLGAPIDSRFVRAAMVDRVNTFLVGRSGVSRELVEQLAKMINAGITPIIPEHGAVGTSGDLVQLAHIAYAIIGEGEVEYKGMRVVAREAFEKENIAIHELLPKEGLALINGTSVMTGIASVLLVEARHLIQMEITTSALAIELVEGTSDAYSESLQNARPHKGQAEVARMLREAFRTSKRIQERTHVQAKVEVHETNVTKTPENLQEVYSFRCVPQILGPILETLERAEAVVAVELNSVTDNPIVDLEAHTFLHGGNFHGDYIATAVDQLKAAIVKLTILSERRINFFLNRNVNQVLSPFLNLNQPGLTLALQGVQFVATSTTAHSQSLAYPHSLHSISTNADNQDVVSMGTDAALIAAKVLENGYIVHAIEQLVLTQAVDVLNCKDQLGQSSQALYERLRAHIRAVTEDRSFSIELNNFISELKKV